MKHAILSLLFLPILLALFASFGMAQTTVQVHICGTGTAYAVKEPAYFNWSFGYVLGTPRPNSCDEPAGTRITVFGATGGPSHLTFHDGAYSFSISPLTVMPGPIGQSPFAATMQLPANVPLYKDGTNTVIGSVTGAYMATFVNTRGFAWSQEPFSYDFTLTMSDPPAEPASSESGCASRDDSKTDVTFELPSGGDLVIDPIPNCAGGDYRKQPCARGKI